MPWRPFCAAIAAAIALAVPLGNWSDTIDAFTSLLPFAAIPALAVFVPGRRRAGPATMGFAIAALAVAGYVIVPELVGAPRATAAAASESRLVMVSQNVAVANPDPVATVNALLASGADIILLQETDGTLAPYHRRLEQRFPFRSPCRRRCSLAIYSRLPMAAVGYRARQAHGEEFGPPLLWAVVELDDGTQIPVASYHQPWPLPAARQSAWRQSLPGALAALGTRKLVLAGDFNLTPWSSAMRRLDRDLAPLRRATRAAFSFPARLGGIAWPVPFLPIDHLYAGPAWRIENVDVLPAGGSDHRAIRVELALVRAGEGTGGR